MGANSLPKTVTRQRRDCDLNPGPSAPESSTLKAKFHYTDPTRTRHGPDTDKVRARCRVRAKFYYTDPHGPNGVSPQKSPCGSGRVRVRVRVVEFSSSPTMCADFVRVGSGPCWVRVVEFSYNHSATEPSLDQSSILFRRKRTEEQQEECGRRTGSKRL